jgi:hypothetical protein
MSNCETDRRDLPKPVAVTPEQLQQVAAGFSLAATLSGLVTKTSAIFGLIYRPKSEASFWSNFF